MWVISESIFYFLVDESWNRKKQVVAELVLLCYCLFPKPGIWHALGQGPANFIYYLGRYPKIQKDKKHQAINLLLLNRDESFRSSPQILSEQLYGCWNNWKTLKEKYTENMHDIYIYIYIYVRRWLCHLERPSPRKKISFFVMLSAFLAREMGKDEY